MFQGSKPGNLEYVLDGDNILKKCIFIIIILLTKDIN